MVEIVEGERITGEGDLGVALLADVDEIGVAEVRSKPGGVALPLHAHARHAATASRFFNRHLPVSGFGDDLRGQNSDFDQHEPPADGGVDPASIVAVRLSE